MKVLLALGVEEDQVAARWPRGRKPGTLTEIFNMGADMLYQRNVEKLYIFEVWDKDEYLGILISPDFNPETDEERKYPWDQIMFRYDNAPLEGTYKEIEIQ